MAGLKPVEFLPLGAGRPWYPRVLVNVVVEDGGPDGTGNVTLSMRVVGEPTVGHVGVRRWIKAWRAQTPATEITEEDS